MDEAQKRYVERSAKKYRATFYMPCARSSNGQRSGRSHRSRSLSARRGSQKRGRSRRLRIRSRMPPGDGVLWRWDTETDQGKLARPGGSPLHPYPDPVNPVEPIPGARGPVCLKFRRRGVGTPSTNGGRRRTAGELEINMNRKKGRAAVPGGTAEAAGITDQQVRELQADISADRSSRGPIHPAPERQVDTFYWQKLCALRALARLCWSTAELQECAIRTLGPDVVPETLTVVLDEELPAYRRAAAGFLLDLIAPGWRRAIGGITISFVRTVPGTSRSRGKAGGSGGRAVRTAPRREARCSARRAS